MIQKNNMHSTHQFIRQQHHQQFQQHHQQHLNQMQSNLQQQREQQERFYHGSGAPQISEQQQRPCAALLPNQPSPANTNSSVDYPPPHLQLHPSPRPHFSPYLGKHQQFVANTDISIQGQHNDPKDGATIVIDGGGNDSKVGDGPSLSVIPCTSNSTINISNNINCINKTKFSDETVAPTSDVESCSVDTNDIINRDDLRTRSKSKNSPRRRHHRRHHNLSNSSSNSGNTVMKGTERSEVNENDCVHGSNDKVNSVKSVKPRRESCSNSPLLQSLIDSQFTLVTAKANTFTDTSTSSGGKKDEGTVKRGSGDNSGKSGQVNAEGKVIPVSSSQQKQHHKSKHKDNRRNSSSASMCDTLHAESVGTAGNICPTSEPHRNHSSHSQHQTPTPNHPTDKQLQHPLRDAEPPTQQHHTSQSQQEQQYHHQDASPSNPPVEAGILYYHPGQSPAMFSGPSYPHGFPQQGFLNAAQQHFPMINPSVEYQPPPHFPHHQSVVPQSLHQVHQNLHHQHQMQQQQFNMALYHQQQGLHPFPHQMVPANLHQSEAHTSCHVGQLPPQGLALLHPPYLHPHPQHLLGGGFQHPPPYPGFHQNALPGYFINATHNNGNLPNMGPYVTALNSHSSQYPPSSFPGAPQQSFLGGRGVEHETSLNLPPPCLMPGHHPSTVGYPMTSESVNVNRSISSPASCLNDLPAHLSNLFIGNSQHSNDNDDISVAGSSVGSRRNHRRNHHRRSPASSLVSESTRVLQENVSAEVVKSGTVSNRSSSETSRTDGSASHHHYRSLGKENVKGVSPGGLYIDSNVRHISPYSDSGSSVRDDNIYNSTRIKGDMSNSSNRVDRRNLPCGKSTKHRIDSHNNFSQGTISNCNGGDYGRAIFLSEQQQQQQHQMDQPQQRGGGGLVFRNINSICAITPPQSPYRGDCDSSGVDVLHSSEETASNATVSSSSSTVRRKHHNHNKHHNANRYHGHPRGPNQHHQEEIATNEEIASSAPNVYSFDSAISYSNSPVGGSPSIGTSGYHRSWEHDSTRDTCGQEGPRNDHSHAGSRIDHSHGGPRNDHGHGEFRNVPSDHPPSSRHHKNHQLRGDGSHLPDAGLGSLSGDGRTFGDEQLRDASFPPLPLARSLLRNSAVVESLYNHNTDSKSRGVKSVPHPASTTFAAAAVIGSTAISSASSTDDNSSRGFTPAADNSEVSTNKTSTSSKKNQIKENKNFFNPSMDNNNTVLGLLGPHHYHHHHHHDIKEEEEEAPALSTTTTTACLPSQTSVTTDGDDSVVVRRMCQAVKRSSNRGQQHRDGFVGRDVFSPNASDVSNAHEPLQMGTVTVGVAARRLIQPLPQLVFARQRLSSRELPDVLTPDTPQFPCAYTKFKLNLK